MLADGDGEAHVQLAADGDHAMGVEAAVGPHCELSPGPAVAHPPHRFPQEVGGAAGGVGAALTQPGHQHVAGSGGNGQQRVIAPLAGIAVVAGALLGQSVGLADRRIKVDGERCVAGSGPSRPGLGQQLPAHPVQLADMAPPETAQEGAQGGGRLDRAAQGAGCPPGAQHIGVVNVLLLAEQGVDHDAGGVIDGQQQREGRTIVSKPPVVAAVHLYQHALAGHPLPADTVPGRPTVAWALQTGTRQYAPQRGSTDLYALALPEQLAQVSVVGIGVAGLSKSQHFGPQRLRRCVGRP